MKLTGKCKEEFLDYVFKNNNVLDTSNDLYLNALIIEWLDTIQYKSNPLFELCFDFFLEA